MFNLPAHMMLDVASLLLSAADVDRREKKVRSMLYLLNDTSTRRKGGKAGGSLDVSSLQEGGLYQQLYQSLCCNLESVHRKILALRANR